ncbi:tetratricopeptide repeat [Halocaridina rubra]|uniref:Tetratricopeptide repeat n=1 Tax=Halocaridina rubra TaxID=373956 RepID=A0AAN8ZZL0_HALRR
MSSMPNFDDVEKSAAQLYEQKNFKEAEKLYTEFIEGSSSSELNETLASAYNNRGHSRYMQVLFDEAIEDYRVALFHDPTHAVAYYNRGTIYYRLCQAHSEEFGARDDQLHKAIADFEMATKYQPENEDFLEGLNNSKQELLKTYQSRNIL